MAGTTGPWVINKEEKTKIAQRTFLVSDDEILMLENRLKKKPV